MRELVWTGRFEAEVQRIYGQLEEQKADEGDVFYQQLLLDLRLLEIFPKLGRPLKGSRLRRFPAVPRRYAVLYVEEPRGVLLHALLDLRDDPARLESIVREMTRLLPLP